MEKKAKQKIGKLLMASLTSQQITCLLDEIFLRTNTDQYMDAFKKADPDMADIVEKILQKSNQKNKKTTNANGLKNICDQRIIAHWHSLWRHWDNIVAEVGDEDGKYAVHDPHWEPPFFDGSMLAYDLEPIATDMLNLIDDVYEFIADPDLFFDALDEISGNISYYPDWMGVEHSEGCTLEENATRCVLKWLWLSVQQDVSPGNSFLDKIYKNEESLEMVDFHDNECLNFFKKLPKDVCHKIYEHLDQNSQQYRLENTYSRWHKLHHYYEEIFNSTKYLESCEEHLANNWKYGLPLVKDTYEKGNYKSAEIYLEKTFASYLDIRDQTKWLDKVLVIKLQ